VPLARPEPLADGHELNDFFSSVISLDDWLKRRARANRVSGASRTYVVVNDHKVDGYYALASGAIAAASSVGRCRPNMPDSIPVAVLGRALFRDCALRVAHAADTIGIRGIVVHSISEQAKGFYLALGFDPSPAEPMTLMVTLADIRHLFDNASQGSGPAMSYQVTLYKIDPVPGRNRGPLSFGAAHHALCKPHGMVGTDIVINRFRQKQALRPIRTSQMCHGHSLLHIRRPLNPLAGAFGQSA